MSGQDLLDPEIARKFAALRRRRSILFYLIVGLGLAVIITQLAAHQIEAFTGLGWVQGLLTLVLLVTLATVWILLAINWRCPACGTPLGRSPTFCRNCGTRLHG